MIDHLVKGPSGRTRAPPGPAAWRRRSSRRRALVDPPVLAPGHDGAWSPLLSMPGPVADIALKLALYANSRAADLGHTASSTLVAFPHDGLRRRAIHQRNDARI